MVIFVMKMAYIFKEGKIISEAPRDKVRKLWTTKLNHKNMNECIDMHNKDLMMNVTVPEETESNIKS